MNRADARRRLGPCAWIAVVLALAGCAPRPPDISRFTAEEREEFRQEMLADLDKVENFLGKTQRGANVSAFTLGWFGMILLNEFASQDADLSAYLHADGDTVEGYLRRRFQNDPKGEIKAMDAMAQRGEKTLRTGARLTLEMLDSIPDPKDPPDIQALSRQELAVTLVRLKGILTRAAVEATSREAPSPR